MFEFGSDTKELMASLIDWLSLILRIQMGFATLMDLLIQFLIAMNPNLMMTLTWTDERIAIVAKTISFVLASTISTAGELAGSRTIFYYIQLNIPTDDKHLSPLDVMTLVQLIIILISGITFRIIIKMKYARRGKNLPSCQIISNEFAIGAVPIPIIIQLSQMYLPETEEEIIQSLGMCYLFTLMICCHKGLRKYSQRRIIRFLNPICECYCQTVNMVFQSKMLPLVSRFTTYSPTVDCERCNIM